MSPWASTQEPWADMEGQWARTLLISVQHTNLRRSIGSSYYKVGQPGVPAGAIRYSQRVLVMVKDKVEPEERAALGGAIPNYAEGLIGCCSAVEKWAYFDDRPNHL